MDPSGAQHFHTTQWSLVAGLHRGAGDSEARAALEHLCESYWGPLYLFVRRSGFGRDDAQDLTQAFLARVIETHGLSGADRERGRFRSYLLGAMKHFMANEWKRARALKRGGGHRLVDRDVEGVEAALASGASHADDADLAFDEAWARTISDAALERVREEWASRGHAERFDAFAPGLTGDGGVPLSELAARLGMTENAVSVASHRLRRRYADLIREAVAETVADESDVDDEVRYLITALRKK